MGFPAGTYTSSHAVRPPASSRASQWPMVWRWTPSHGATPRRLWACPLAQRESLCSRGGLRPCCSWCHRGWRVFVASAMTGMGLRLACTPEGLFHEAPQQSTLMHSLQAKPV
jgi:hypothetical protein